MLEQPPPKILRYRAISRTLVILVMAAIVILQIFLLISIQGYGKANHGLAESNRKSSIAETELLTEQQTLLTQIKTSNTIAQATLDLLNKTLVNASTSQKKFIALLVANLNAALTQQLSNIRFEIDAISPTRTIVRVVSCVRACKRRG